MKPNNQQVLEAVQYVQRYLEGHWHRNPKQKIAWTTSKQITNKEGLHILSESRKRCYLHTLAMWKTYKAICFEPNTTSCLGSS